MQLDIMSKKVDKNKNLEYQADRSTLRKDDLEGIKDLLRTHIEIRNRSFMKRVHRDCFLGSDAVDFMVRHGLSDSRSQAVQIGKRLCDEKFFRPVGDNSRFKDASHLYYRFAEDDQEISMLSATNGGHGSSILSNGVGIKSLTVNENEDSGEKAETAGDTNDTGPVLGQDGNKWCFCPHTAHNSYIMDVGLAQEIERVCAHENTAERLLTFQKLRDRVKEVFNEDAPNWSLAQSQEVHDTVIAVYQRKRPRGDFKNLKMTGTVGSGPREWIQGILGFDMRKQWESQFEDGVVVEGIDLGEPDIEVVMKGVERDTSISTTRFDSALSTARDTTSGGIGGTTSNSGSLHQLSTSADKSGDELLSFLKTVDLAGIPVGMAIAMLGGAERERTLGHLRKQMMLSSPEACMSCNRDFSGPADIRFCPCCAMISCTNCVRHRVFEVAQRKVVNVCVHCFEESSRIKQPPKIEGEGNVGAWTLETLEFLEAEAEANTPRSGGSGNEKANPMLHGLDSVSMSLMGSSNNTAADALFSAAMSGNAGMSQLQEETGRESETDGAAAGSSGDDENSGSKPLLDGLEEGDDKAGGDKGSTLNGNALASSVQELGDGVGRQVDEGDESQLGPIPAASKAKDIAQAAITTKEGYARCRKCGELIKRDMLSIEAHQAVCTAVVAAGGNKDKDKGTGALPKSSSASDTSKSNQTSEEKSDGSQSPAPGSSPSQSPGSGGLFRGIKNALGLSSGKAGKDKDKEGTTETSSSPDAGSLPKHLSGKSMMLEKSFSFHAGAGGGGRDLSKSPTRVIYRTARAHQSALFNFRPREVCALQDSFVDEQDGSCYVYEVSVRHSEVFGSPGYVTADVLMHAFCAKPFYDNDGKVVEGASTIAIISQVDTRAKGPGQFYLTMVQGADGSDTIGIPRKRDVERELASNGNLTNILKQKKEKKKKIKGHEGAGGASKGDGTGDVTGEEGDSGEGEDEEDDDNEDNDVSLDAFELLAVLGRGGFGKVMQVRHRDTGEVYAMKILKKSELVRRRQVERTQTERTILAAVQHPFIVCLHYAFQNSQKLYMVMDFVQGGDFFTLMRKFKRLPESWVRIYVGEIALALQHLHDMDVVYRDLKPENILLCGDGHLKLTDFGLSRYFETRPPNPEDMISEDDMVTRSFCGTEQYMSPEMLLQQGHNFRMDWWCVGLLMHEMLSARHPFSGPTHYDTLRNMVTKQPNIDSRVSTNAASVIRSLLIKNPRARMCCQHGCGELKSLAFFAELDWEALLEKRIPMAHIPEIQGETDVSSFETTFTREEAVDSVATEMAVSTGGKKDGLPVKKEKKGSILSYLGLGGKDKDNASKDAAATADSFRHFSFVKPGPDGDNSAPVTPTAAGGGAGGEQPSPASGVEGEGSSPPTFTKAAPIRSSKKMSSSPATGDNTEKGTAEEAAIPPAPPL